MNSAAFAIFVYEAAEYSLTGIRRDLPANA